MPQLDFYQEKEFSEVMLLADSVELGKVVAQLIFDRDASQRLFVEACRDRGYKPCARVGKPFGSLSECNPIIWMGAQPAAGTILYSAV